MLKQRHCTEETVPDRFEFGRVGPWSTNGCVSIFAFWSEENGGGLDMDVADPYGVGVGSVGGSNHAPSTARNNAGSGRNRCVCHSRGRSLALVIVVVQLVVSGR